MNLNILSLLFLSVFFSFSQTDLEKDPKAKAILDNVSKSTKTYSTITSEYSLIIYNKEKKKVEEQNGKIELKGEKFRLEIPGNLIVSDGKTLWNFNKDSKELTIKNYNPNDDKNETITPNNFFTIYENGYKYKYDKKENVGKISCDVINLYPAIKPEKKKFHTIKLYIDNKKKQIVQAKVLMKNGEVYVYTVKKFTPNLPIADNVFVYDTKGLKSDQIVDERE
ncbi:MAG TPA: outer membrane lipoprotein carrier protein LolA [Bacteroidia bacterium]|nr:outer membrane lipoprotein carrier protein LolA [Bacteroidia bacterium]